MKTQHFFNGKKVASYQEAEQLAKAKGFNWVSSDTQNWGKTKKIFHTFS